MRPLSNRFANLRLCPKATLKRFQLDRLEKLPLGLIKARIARGLSHRELAERLGVRPQQVQRWEHEEYENVGFSRLVEIAAALEVVISENIYLPKKGKSALASLKALGIDRQFLVSRLIPQAAEVAQTGIDEIVAATKRLSKIFGIELLSNGSIADTGRMQNSCAAMRFKIPSNAEAQRVRAYAIYVTYLAKTVAASIEDTKTVPIPSSWDLMRSSLFPDGVVEYAGAVHRVWEMGVPVIPLSDPIRFHGCCIRVRGRNVVVLKQSNRVKSRWLFDLVHELYHATEDPLANSFKEHCGEATDLVRREADSERAANEFAGNVLLNGHAAELFSKVLSLAQYEVPRLKDATSVVASDEFENVGILANYVAFRLRAESFIDWWGTASNLQPDGEDAFEITRRIFFERVSPDHLEDDDRDIIIQALAEPLARPR